MGCRKRRSSPCALNDTLRLIAWCSLFWSLNLDLVASKPNPANLDFFEKCEPKRDCTPEFGYIPLINRDTSSYDFNSADVSQHPVVGFTWVQTPLLIPTEIVHGTLPDTKNNPVYAKMEAAHSKLAGVTPAEGESSFQFPFRLKSEHQANVNAHNEPGTFVRAFQQVAKCGDYRVLGTAATVLRRFRTDDGKRTCFEDGIAIETLAKCSVCPEVDG